MEHLRVAINDFIDNVLLNEELVKRKVGFLDDLSDNTELFRNFKTQRAQIARKFRKRFDDVYEALASKQENLTMIHFNYRNREMLEKDFMKKTTFFSVVLIKTCWKERNLLS